VITWEVKAGVERTQNPPRRQPTKYDKKNMTKKDNQLDNQLVKEF